MPETSEARRVPLAARLRARAGVPSGTPDAPLLFVLVSLSAALTLVSIVVSQVLFFSALALAAARTGRGENLLRMPARLRLPLALFFAWTMAAALLSPAPAANLGIAKKFGLFLVLALAAGLLRAPGRARWAYGAIFAVAALAAAAGIVQFALDPSRDMLNRIHGFMGQWMTYSGLQMLVLVALAADAVAHGVRRGWVVGLGALLAASLYLSYTRNAWLGAAVGVVVVLALRRPRAIVPVLALVLAVALAGPGRVRERLRTAVDRSDTTTRGRLELLSTGYRLVRDHPWFGVGPKSVKSEALRYRGDPQFPVWLYQHMHNNVVQIAAERGLPGLALWVWFMVALVLDPLRQLRRLPRSDTLSIAQREALATALAALGAWSALVVSGLFEYNFGDSEILLLFLFMMALPHATAGRSAAPETATPRQA